jgi:cytochrome b involved in lipid metabolism
VVVVIAIISSKSDTKSDASYTADQTQMENATTSVSAPTSTEMTTSTSTSSQPVEMIYTTAQVAMHASAQSCWTIISGAVYDLTSWIQKHPGGSEAILKLCGKDGTTTFMNQHGGMEKQAAQLATFKIGTLKN